MNPQSQAEDEARVRAFATDWFHKLDNHAPPDDYETLLDGDHLEMRMPEGTFRGFSGFRQWYERVLGLFFDEVHTIKQVVVASGGAADLEVKVVVHWEASTWTPPNAKSRRIKMDAYQTWVLTLSPVTGSYVIKTYTVDDLKYDPDSARL